MAWGCQATSHSLSIWGPWSMSLSRRWGLMSYTEYSVSDITTAHQFRLTNTLIFQSSTNIPFLVSFFTWLPSKVTYVLTHHLLELLFSGCARTLTPLTHQRWGNWPRIQLFGWYTFPPGPCDLSQAHSFYSIYDHPVPAYECTINMSNWNWKYVW